MTTQARTEEVSNHTPRQSLQVSRTVNGKFTFLSLNANSLFNKMDELQTLTATLPTPPLFISICETWCNPNEPDSLYALPKYLLYRRDRRGRCGGGVALYVLESAIAACERLKNVESDNEDLWIKVQLKEDNRTLTISSMYRPPDSDYINFVSSLERSLHKLQRYSTTYLILTGDFNARCSEWLESDKTDSCGEALSELFHTYSLEQIVHFPTNLHCGQLKACIDLIATNATDLQVSSLAPLGKSDHIVLKGAFPAVTVQPAKHLNSRLVWCWKRANIQGLQEAIVSEKWCDVLECDNVESAWIRWRAKILQLATQFIPRRRVCSSLTPSPWMNGELRRNIQLKHRLYKQYKRTKTSEEWENFRKQRNLVSKQLKEAKSNYVLQLQTSNQELAHNEVNSSAPRTWRPNRHIEPEQDNEHFNLPRLHQLLRLLLNGNRSRHISDLQLSDGSTAQSDADKAEALNAFFVCQSEQSAAPGPVPPILTAPSVVKLCDIQITVNEVEHLLSTLDLKKAAGDDGVPTRLLRLTAKSIAPHIHHLFNLSLKHGQLPQEWKQATVTPVYKKGNRSLASNYRPISLLSILSKVLERIIFKRLYKQVNPLLPTCQSGFRKGDGTVHQLTRIVHTLAEALDNRKAVVSCYFDLSKAFDRVWHEGLLAKLAHIGIGGSLLDWFCDYLKGRVQRVRVDTAVSSWKNVPAGVPQGSVLGPLLFLIYTSDLPEQIESPVTCNLFADDTALCSIAQSVSISVEALQLATTNSGKWLKDWRLSVNLAKTSVMATTRTVASVPVPSIYLYGESLQSASSQRHLGVMLSADLRWSCHIDFVLSRAARLLGVLKRLRSSLSMQASIAFYKLYIRPKLEYADVVWCGLSKHQADRLERFQLRIARIILNQPLYSHTSHSFLLTTLNLHTLSSRRSYHLALLSYKIKHNLAPKHLLDVCFKARTQHYKLRHTQSFDTPIPRTQLFLESPLFKSSTIFDSLPPVKILTSFSAFQKKAAQHILSTHCDCSTYPYYH